MKRSIGAWELMGAAVTALAGTLLHFLYDWAGGVRWIAPLSGVNESTWEHMKLLFWPAFIFAVVQSFFFKSSEGFWCIKLKGTLLGLVLIPVIFYTYNGAVGTSPDWINIAIFFVSVAAVYLCEARLFQKGSAYCPFPKLAFGVLCALAVLFVIFTFETPELGIFQDPLTLGKRESNTFSQENERFL